NIRLPQLQHELMRRWRMPTLMVALTDDEQQAQKVQVRNVTLAVRLARHSALGWDNAALPDDLHDIAALLNLTVEPATRLVHEIDGT
ncbi:MAG: histidine kinase, partial [Rubrivivax sp.]|nr:histidine kinase [Rubrivivax sp.]